jgi:hypothetical protein
MQQNQGKQFMAAREAVDGSKGNSSWQQGKQLMAESPIEIVTALTTD